MSPQVTFPFKYLRFVGARAYELKAQSVLLGGGKIAQLVTAPSPASDGRVFCFEYISFNGRELTDAFKSHAPLKFENCSFYLNDKFRLVQEVNVRPVSVWFEGSAPDLALLQQGVEEGRIAHVHLSKTVLEYGQADRLIALCKTAIQKGWKIVEYNPEHGQDDMFGHNVFYVGAALKVEKVPKRPKKVTRRGIMWSLWLSNVVSKIRKEEP